IRLLLSQHSGTTVVAMSHHNASYHTIVFPFYNGHCDGFTACSFMKSYCLR
ncbi:Uncharacterized protein APZ42_009752, partial [Daphnia magna]